MSRPEDLGPADIAIVDPAVRGHPVEFAARYPEVGFGRFVDAPTPEPACRSARTGKWSPLFFRDQTKIPPEIVIAAATGALGNIVAITADVEEAEIIFGVLELGSDGVLMAPSTVGDATALEAVAAGAGPDLELVELTVTATAPVGMGERACVDTCTYLREDEGMLVGSHSQGMILCVGETRPLPNRPARPFRVNAGAIRSRTLSEDSRTHHLGELRTGSKVLAVDVEGRTRVVTVGRVKIESRPLISIDAAAPDGRTVNLVLQDDRHVRVLGPGGGVLDGTELRPGDVVLGYLPQADRHVGYPIDEFRPEQ